MSLVDCVVLTSTMVGAVVLTGMVITLSDVVVVAVVVVVAAVVVGRVGEAKKVTGTEGAVVVREAEASEKVDQFVNCYLVHTRLFCDVNQFSKRKTAPRSSAPISHPC